MLAIQDAYHASDLPRGGIATIGNYDGVHRGQRAVIERVVERAREEDLLAMVVTFDPHPLAVLRPAEAPRRLVPPEEKRRLIEETGVDVLLTVRFTDAFAATPAREFIEKFLVRRLDVREIYVGQGFVFGRGREGNLDLLSTLGEELGFAAFGVPEVELQGDRVSSTRIRRALVEGKVEDAATMLGRPYGLWGKVARGDRMGQRLGWPTINLDPESELVPAEGVYAGQVYFPSLPGTFQCVTNIGTRPTVYENYQRVVESHILDFATDVYGERVEIRFHKRLREERIFPSVMDLASQIGRDVEAAREYFAHHGGFEGQAREYRDHQGE